MGRSSRSNQNSYIYTIDHSSSTARSGTIRRTKSGTQTTQTDGSNRVFADRAMVDEPEMMDSVPEGGGGVPNAATDDRDHRGSSQATVKPPRPSTVEPKPPRKRPGYDADSGDDGSGEYIPKSEATRCSWAYQRAQSAYANQAVPSSSPYDDGVGSTTRSNHPYKGNGDLSWDGNPTPKGKSKGKSRVYEEPKEDSGNTSWAASDPSVSTDPKPRGANSYGTLTGQVEYDVAESMLDLRNPPSQGP